MPVEDIAVHQKTIASERFDACQTKVRQDGYYALDRKYYEDGSFKVYQRYIKDTSSKLCRTRGINDPRCVGCEFPKDIEWLNRAR